MFKKYKLGGKTNEETIGKALKIYHILLEKKNEGFGFCLKKNDEELVEFLL